MVVSVNSSKLVALHFLKLLESFVLSSHPYSQSLQAYSPWTFLYFHVMYLDYMALNVRFDGEKALPSIFHSPFVTLSGASPPSGARVCTLPSPPSPSSWGFSNCTQKLQRPTTQSLDLSFPSSVPKEYCYRAIISSYLREINHLLCPRREIKQYQTGHTLSNAHWLTYFPRFHSIWRAACTSHFLPVGTGWCCLCPERLGGAHLEAGPPSGQLLGSSHVWGLQGSHLVQFTHFW